MIRTIALLGCCLLTACGKDAPPPPPQPVGQTAAARAMHRDIDAAKAVSDQSKADAEAQQKALDAAVDGEPAPSADTKTTP